MASNPYILDPRLRRALARFLARKRYAILAVRGMGTPSQSMKEAVVDEFKQHCIAARAVMELAEREIER